MSVAAERGASIPPILTSAVAGNWPSERRSTPGRGHVAVVPRPALPRPARREREAERLVSLFRCRHRRSILSGSIATIWASRRVIKGGKKESSFDPFSLPVFPHCLYEVKYYDDGDADRPL